jgi:hypothetical protein
VRGDEDEDDARGGGARATLLRDALASFSSELTAPRVRVAGFPRAAPLG